MRDSLDLFRTLINWKKKNYTNLEIKNGSNNAPKQLVKESLLFDKVSIILFLNKEDLFEEKFKSDSLSASVSLKACFEDYQDNDQINLPSSSSCSRAKEFIAHKFIECASTNTDKSDGGTISSKRRRDIYWHYTFALDRKNVETVVAGVKDKIMRYMLESMRL